MLLRYLPRTGWKNERSCNPINSEIQIESLDKPIWDFLLGLYYSDWLCVISFSGKRRFVWTRFLATHRLWQKSSLLKVQSRFAETLTLTLTLNPNPNFGESGFGESGIHPIKAPPYYQGGGLRIQLTYFTHAVGWLRNVCENRRLGETTHACCL